MTPEDFENMSSETIWEILPNIDGLAKADALQELSDRAFREKKYDVSFSTAEQAEALAREIPDLTLASRARHRQGMCNYRRRQYAEAIENFKVSAQLSSDSGDLYGLVNCLNWVADAALACDEHEVAFVHAKNALEIGESEDMPGLSGWAAYFAAKARFYQTGEKDSLDYLLKARNHFRKGNDLSLVGMVDDMAATVHDRFEEYDVALSLLISCLHIAEVTSNKHDDPYANRRVGNAYQKVQRFDDALHHLTKARKSYQEIDHLSYVAYCEREIADALYMLDRDREALSTLERAQSLFDSMGDDVWYRSCLIKRSQIHEYLGELGQAVRLYKQIVSSMESDKNFDNWNQHFWAKLSLGNLYIQAQEYSTALEIIDSLNETTFSPSEWNLVRKRTLRARVLSEMNRTEEALSEVEAALALTTDENLDGGTAFLYEIRGQHLLDNGKKSGERDIAHAIAIHLASGEDDRARDLAKVFMPKYNHEKDLGLGTSELIEAEENRNDSDIASAS